jgi:large subunit ribosomal protein L18
LGVQAAALEVGKKLGALCKEKGISTVVFDRGGFMYHGRIAVSPSPGRLFPLV